jgi:hypothetical protein
MSDEINNILCGDSKKTKNNAIKIQYIERIRAESAYPAFRSLVNLSAGVSVFCGAICILVGMIFILIGMVGLFASREGGQGLILAIAGIVLILITKASKEASLMLADLVDSITDSNSQKEDEKKC